MSFAVQSVCQLFNKDYRKTLSTTSFWRPSHCINIDKALGSFHWTTILTSDQNPNDSGPELLRDIKGPFNIEDREKAGMSREFYENLKGEMPYTDAVDGPRMDMGSIRDALPEVRAEVGPTRSIENSVASGFDNIDPT
ncbi:hypothetical protein BT96DRAFT_942304 [Gymnopus androsaceus JB14]|uniref:Uncharacterized protein n=1 Tax=Gymnopus androsaceus JB14 TaxID=1447944 RepID=A0A6A4HCU3_9AGAR|nr:hypothetical protein BT96DRAFT_942304 [Gymnopus androsaceus JB14]